MLDRYNDLAYRKLFLMNLVGLISKVFDLFMFVLFAWVLMSWIPDLRKTSFFQSLDSFFGKMLAPIRQLVPPIGGTIDISPIILILLLKFIVMPVLISLASVLSL
ncbi:MAG: YggT family protein [Candidatus Caenarcaniphilales bacterium]|nr:YggT family protein [Candidatus Caenarcaniphilales bacterium]